MTQTHPQDMPSSPAPDYGKTLQLPRTDFPMRANLPAREPGWVQRWLDEDLYGTLLAKRRAEGAPTAIVHLGPPYANGNLHLGHLLAYGLKDTIVRHQFLMGRASPYVPGFDCHGLPIEWKIEQELIAAGQTKHTIPLTELRARCRAYAQHWSDVQLKEWQRFGAIADWARPYRTMDKTNEAGIVDALGQLVQRGMVYQKLRSTLWAPVEETALAEAEIEYDEQHKSTAIHLALELVDRPGEYLVIWTTTPWTLPANRAVAVNQEEDYYLLEHKETGKPCWLASNLFTGPEQKQLNFVTENFRFIGSFKENYRVSNNKYNKSGKDLLGLTYKHPLYADRTGQVVHGDHVTTDSGTGLVHIAPAHGAEDFYLGEKLGLDPTCPVDGSGKYEAWVDDGLPAGLQLGGRSIWEAQREILAHLEQVGTLLHKDEDYTHKYPISWRSKKPVIFRTTTQWFIDLDNVPVPETGKSIRQSALDLIHARENVRGVEWVPASGENRIGSMIANRPDWCISRQRAWGVPITIMVDKGTGQPVADPAVWQHLVQLVAAEGIDAWETRLAPLGAGREAELFPAGWLAAQGKTPEDFAYVRDILDVWFDSGTTWHHVVKADSGPGQRFERQDGKRLADVYEEGSDQHRGWFHSSLLTCVALTGDAPYESVVTHGFVVDSQGRKFSKSLGNGLAPQDLLGRYGMDILRLWVSGSDFAEDIRYSEAALEGMADTYRKLRNVMRWLLGNLPAQGEAVAPLNPAQLPELEAYILHRLQTVLSDTRAAYEKFQFHAGLRLLLGFCTTELSNFYFDVRKDVLYCNAPTDPTRQACVAVLEEVLRGLLTHLAPLLPFTTDEAWRSRYGETTCVHLETYHQPPAVQIDAARWEALLQLRDDANLAIEAQRAAGAIGPNAEAALTYPASLNLPAELIALVVNVSQAQPGATLQVEKHFGHKCPRCWRYYATLSAAGLCTRCTEALHA